MCLITLSRAVASGRLRSTASYQPGLLDGFRPIDGSGRWAQSCQHSPRIPLTPLRCTDSAPNPSPRYRHDGNTDDGEKQQRGVVRCPFRILPLQEVQGVSRKVLKLRVARLEIGDPRSEDCLAGHLMYSFRMQAIDRLYLETTRPYSQFEQLCRKATSKLTHDLTAPLERRRKS
jgi:hypothetical protein